MLSERLARGTKRVVKRLIVDVGEGEAGATAVVGKIGTAADDRFFISKVAPTVIGDDRPEVE